MLEINFAEPSLKILRLIHGASNTNDFTAVFDHLVNNGAEELYKQMVNNNIVKYDQKLLKKIQKSKEALFETLIKEAPTNLDNEEFIRRQAEFYAKTFDLENFEAKTKEPLETNKTSSMQLDILFCKIRIALILDDKQMLNTNILKAKEVSILADWDRKNRFKVYLGVYSIRKADFVEAAKYFYECLASFEAEEILSFNEVILYLVFSGLLVYSRNDLEKKLINNFEVLKLKEISAPAEAFYNCEYSKLLSVLINFSDLMDNDVFIQKYREYFVREMMCKGYVQFLSSYQSVGITKMAEVFGVRDEFLEEDLRKFTINKRIGCEIDKLDNLITVLRVKKEEDVEKNLLDAEDILKLIRKVTNK